jgi:hypothetical protein
MLLIGALSCIPAATSGLYAYYETVRHAGMTDSPFTEPAQNAWYQLVRDAQDHLSLQQWNDLKHHIWRAVSGTILINLALLLYLGASDRLRKRLYFPLLLLLLFAIVVLMSGAWHAGESVFTRGTAQEPDATGISLDSHHIDSALRGIVPPLQFHVMLAGITVALALAALAMSIRALVMSSPPSTRPSRTRPPMPETHDTAYADSPIPERDLALIQPPPRLHVGRFWLLTTLLAVGTACAGLWVAGWNWEQLRPLFAQPRDLAHMILGTAMVLLTIILAGATRWAARRKWLLGGLASLLLLIIGVQIWMGILLMYDGSDGASNLFQFRKPIVQTVARG